MLTLDFLVLDRSGKKVAREEEVHDVHFRPLMETFLASAAFQRAEPVEESLDQVHRRGLGRELSVQALGQVYQADRLLH